VTVNFATTLARAAGAAQDGVPVILGSSQTQVVTMQDGLAAIIPSTGNVGPCDVFITVSAGALTAKFEMENLAAIVPPQAGDSPMKLRSPPPAQHFGGKLETADPPPMLFALPEGDLVEMETMGAGEKLPEESNESVSQASSASDPSNAVGSPSQAEEAGPSPELDVPKQLPKASAVQERSKIVPAESGSNTGNPPPDDK